MMDVIAQVTAQARAQAEEPAARDPVAD